MFHNHTTRDGKTVMICAMDDGHLINTIKLMCRKLTEMVEAASPSEQMDEYHKRLYNVTQVSQTKAADLTKRAAEIIAPYALEAILRGLAGDIEPNVQAAFDRKVQVILPKTSNLLVAVGPQYGDRAIDMLLDDEFAEDVDGQIEF
jgi:hypothetical protein